MRSIKGLTVIVLALGWTAGCGHASSSPTVAPTGDYCAAFASGTAAIDGVAAQMKSDSGDNSFLAFLQAGVTPVQVAQVLDAMVAASAPSDVHRATVTMATFFEDQAAQVTAAPGALPSAVSDAPDLADQAAASATIGGYLARC